MAILIELSRERGEPLYLQISDQIHSLILSGDLPVGARLPICTCLAAG